MKQEEDRIEKRKKKRKKKKRRRKFLLLRLLLLIALGVGAWQFLTSDFFNVTSIKVGKVEHCTGDEVIARSGLKKGENILFDISPSAAEKKLLKDPYIKSAVVKRRLPDGLSIKVKERKEYAAVIYGTEFILIDDEGVALKKADAAPELPLLSGIEVKKIEPGKTLDVKQSDLLADTLELLHDMEKSDLYFKQIEISDVLVKAYIYDTLICEGTPDNIREGMENIRLVLQEMQGRGIERGVIRVNSSNQWAWSPLVE